MTSLLLMSLVSQAQSIERLRNLEEYNRNLIAIAREEFKKKNASLTDESQLLVNKFIANGARKLAQEENPDFEAAQKNLKKFADEVIRQGERNDDKIRITKDSVIKATLSLCPLYPFC